MRAKFSFRKYSCGESTLVGSKEAYTFVTFGDCTAQHRSHSWDKSLHDPINPQGYTHLGTGRADVHMEGD